MCTISCVDEGKWYQAWTGYKLFMSVFVCAISCVDEGKWYQAWTGYKDSRVSGIKHGQDIKTGG